MQYLIFAGMISYYGFEYIEEICQMFKETEFIYSSMSMVNILKNLNLYNSQEENMLKVGKMPAFCVPGVVCDGKLTRKNSIFITTDYDLSPVDLLDSVAHECNHVVNSINKSILIDDGKVFFRTGLSVSGKSDSNGHGLEEGINVLQTADIINEILRLTEFDIDDPFIANAISNIKYARGTSHSGKGYEFLVPFIKLLYDNRTFCSVVKDARMSGDIDKIEWEFDRKVGKNAFSELKLCTDEFVSNPIPDFSECIKVKSLVYSYLNN